MPIYEYECQDCRQKTELLVGVQAQQEALECPYCHSRSLERCLSLFAVNVSKASPASCKSCEVADTPGAGCPGCCGALG